MKVGKGLYGPRTADMAERLGLSPSPCKKLGRGRQAAQVSAERAGRQGLEAAQRLRFACSPFMAGFMELKHSERGAKKVVKLTQNAIFGRCCMNPDKFRNTNAYVGPAQV